MKAEMLRFISAWNKDLILISCQACTLNWSNIWIISTCICIYTPSRGREWWFSVFLRGEYIKYPLCKFLRIATLRKYSRCPYLHPFPPTLKNNTLANFIFSFIIRLSFKPFFALFLALKFQFEFKCIVLDGTLFKN